MPFIGRRRGDSTIEEKWSTVSGVIQCFHLGKKRGRVAPVSEGERIMRGGSRFPHRWATEGSRS
jgi:hypothetical protein